MTKTLRVMAGMLLLSGCSRLPSSHAGAAHPEPTPAPPVVLSDSPVKAHGEMEPETPAPDPRRVGDVVVHRFSGSYRKSPLVLTERVVDKQGDDWVIDLSLEEAGKVSRLRVHMDREGRVNAVARLTFGKQRPASLDDYAALLEKTSLAADVNDGLIGAERSTCLVGARELDCETKSYKVWVADKAATLRVTSSQDLPGQDVGGEITGQDGRLLYRAELVSFEHAESEPSVAAR